MRPKMASAEQMVQTQGGMKPEFFSPLGYLPTRELGLVLGGAEAPRALARTAIESINPLLKTPIEAAMNYDTFFNRPISDYPGEREQFLGLGAPPTGEYLARQLVPPLQQARRMFDPDIDPGVRAGRDGDPGGLPAGTPNLGRRRGPRDRRSVAGIVPPAIFRKVGSLESPSSRRSGGDRPAIDHLHAARRTGKIASDGDLE